MTAIENAVNVALGPKPVDDEIDYHGLTHPGKVRTENQDHFLLSSLHKRMDVHLTSLPDTDRLYQEAERLAFLAMVADGVGGRSGGGEASRLALEAVSRCLLVCPDFCFEVYRYVEPVLHAAELQEDVPCAP